MHCSSSRLLAFEYSMNTISRIIQTVAAVGLVTAASLIVHPCGAVKKQDSLRPIFEDANLDRSTELLFLRACQNCHSERTI